MDAADIAFDKVVESFKIIHISFYLVYRASISTFSGHPNKLDEIILSKNKKTSGKRKKAALINKRTSGDPFLPKATGAITPGQSKITSGKTKKAQRINERTSGNPFLPKASGAITPGQSKITSGKSKFTPGKIATTTGF